MLVEFLSQHGPVTMEALTDEYGLGTIPLRLPGKMNVVLWPHGTQGLCAALDALLARGMLRLLPTSPHDYREHPDLPLYRKGLDDDCWLPVLVGIRPARVLALCESGTDASVRQ